jgi:hypothetical protein
MSGESRADTGGEAERLRSDRLHAYIDELLGSDTQEGPDLDEAIVSMSRILADRVGDHGADPLNYAIAITTVTYDCGVTGVNGFTDEPMPPEVTGLSSSTYESFRTHACDMARHVMGDTFGDTVDMLFIMGLSQ